MANVTEVIRYNLKDRGRRYRGTPRNFNIPVLMDAINGGATQERVKHRDMLGYYGHWPRVRLGLDPREGGIIDGKVVHVEPAFVTTSLKCSLYGTIEHVAEFFDNVPGKAAAGLKASKAGGFSSAIDENKPQFYGFDYVLEPNFTTNRPYALALDGADSDPLTMDEVNDYMQSALDVALLLDGVNGENRRLRQALLNMEAEREEIMDELVRRTGKRPALDSVLIATAKSSKAELFAQAEALANSHAEVRVTPAAPVDAQAERQRRSYMSLIGFGR